MKTAISSANTDRQSDRAGTAGKLHNLMLCNDMEINRLEGMLRVSKNDEQLLAILELTENGTCEAAKLREAMCERKSRYDKRGARTTLNDFAKKRGRHGRPDNLRAYPCPFCAGWHLTKAVSEASEFALTAHPIQGRKNSTATALI
jgi:hypothetical protein